MSSLIEALTSLLILIGVFFSVVGTLGILRMPDVYNRIHALSKASSLGVVSILLASSLHFLTHSSAFSMKELAILVFLYLSNPVGAHAILRAAYLVGVPLWERTVGDHLQHEKSTHHE